MSATAEGVRRCAGCDADISDRPAVCKRCSSCQADVVRERKAADSRARRARPKSPRHCEVCRGLLPAGRRRYCGDDCYKIGHIRLMTEKQRKPRVEWVCAAPGCGVKIGTERHLNRRYCSRNCALAAKRERYVAPPLLPPPRTWGGPPFEVVRERLVAARRRGEDFRDAWPRATHAGGKSDTLNAVALAETWESWANAYERIPATQAEAAAARLLGGW